MDFSMLIKGLAPIVIVSVGFIFFKDIFKKDFSSLFEKIFKKKQEETKNNIKIIESRQADIVVKIKNNEAMEKETEKKIEAVIEKANAEVNEILRTTSAAESANTLKNEW